MVSKTEPDELEDLESGPSQLLVREYQQEVEESEGITAQVEIQGDINFLTLHNKVLLGYEYTNLDTQVRVAGSDTDDDAFGDRYF